MIHKAPFINKYKLSLKTLSTLNIYKIVMRLKSKVLRKEDSRLVADRQMQIVFCSCSKPFTLDRHAHHLSYQGGLKSPSHIFFVWSNLDCFDLGTSEKSYVLSQGRDVACIGHWPRAIYLFDRQTDILTYRQTNRLQTYKICRA